MVEVMFAIVILAVGLLGLAALMASLTGTTTQSRYLGTEVMLASEKLEDLSQLPIGDARIAVGGGLDPTKPVANFNDEVQVSSDNGVIKDNPGGGAPGAASSDMLRFQRLWVIETGVAGLGNAKRITVLVVPLTGTALEKAATFQTSTVRQ
jgi:hypothetical protein